MRVAIVDDVRSDAQVLQDHLRRYQEEGGGMWETVLYPSGTDFLARYQPDFDLVILDIDMPGLNGVDAARRIRELEEEQRLIGLALKKMEPPGQCGTKTERGSEDEDRSIGTGEGISPGNHL